jgi:protein-S-isoprenylcysteine O-methyltransferase Ste14
VIAILFKLRREEMLVTSVFGKQYRQFQREVPALVPFLI